MTHHQVKRAPAERIHGSVARGERCRAAGRYRQALRWYEQALAAAKQTFGARSAEVATLHNNLGVVCKYLGRFGEAAGHYRRALRILKTHGQPAGGKRVDRWAASVLAPLYHNLGGLEHARGRFARGEPFARHGARLREQALGPRHPDVAADLAALAALLDGQGKYDEAERLYRRALGIFRRTFGPEHYEVGVNLNNLGALYQARGDLVKAGRFYRRALALKEKLLGQTHPDIAITCNNLAILHRQQGKLSSAMVLYRRALAIFTKRLGRSHPHTRASRANYERLRGTRELAT